MRHPRRPKDRTNPGSTNTQSGPTPLPFWLRLREISTYPFRGAALYSLIALTLLSLLGIVPVLGWIIVLLLWVAAYKYAFEILRTTADGRMESPEAALGTDDGAVVRLLGMMIVFGILAIAALALGGPVIGLLVVAAIVFLQPGCVISLALDGGLPRALNPATSLGLVARIGWPYLAVFGLLFVIQASALTAGAWLSRVMPPVLADLSVTAVSFWGLFATFHLMGYLIYQYHDVLGYEPDHSATLPGRHSPDRDLLAEAEDYVRDGQLDTALELLRSETRSRAVGIDAHELYHRLLRQHGDTPALVEHAGQYLNLLMLEAGPQHERRALGLLRETLDADAAFVPLQLEHAVQLLERARSGGQSQLAVDTWRALLGAHPRHPDAPAWGLAAALMLSDRLGRDDAARTLLVQARQRCEAQALLSSSGEGANPEDPAHEEAQRKNEALLQKIDAALKALQATTEA
jgi:hypothetical protein